jgi:hypothetical protein
MNPKVIQAILRSIGSASKKIAKYNRRSFMPKDGNVRYPWQGNPVRSLGSALSRDKMDRREFLKRSKIITGETRDLTKLSINSQKLKDRQDRANIFLLANRKKASLIDQAETNRLRYIKTEYLKHKLKLGKRLQTDSKFYEKTKKATMDEIVGDFIDGSTTKKDIQEAYSQLKALPKEKMTSEILSRSEQLVTGDYPRWFGGSPFNKLTGINKFNLSGKSESTGKVIKKSKAKMTAALESAGVTSPFRKKLDKELKISKFGGLRGGGRGGSKLEKAQTKLKKKLTQRKNAGKGMAKEGYHQFIESVAPYPSGSVKDLSIQEAFDNRPGGILKYINRLTKEKAKENPLLQAFREGLYGE